MKAKEHIEWVLGLEEKHNEILAHIGADNVTNAKRKINAERRDFERTKEQLGEVVSALEVDNWRNAVVRARSLLDKLEKEGLPNWLRTISPAWKGTVAPSMYRKWLSFCREQFLVAQAEMLEEAQLFPEFDVEAEVENLRELYLTAQPHEFIEAISQFVTPPPEDEGGGV